MSAELTPRPPVSQRRDWLVLSLKWSTGDWLVWYRTARCGYTQCLLTAGRFTEEEARTETVRGATLAVPLTDVCPEEGGRHVIHNNTPTMMRLLEAAKSRKIRTARSVTDGQATD